MTFISVVLSGAFCHCVYNMKIKLTQHKHKAHCAQVLCENQAAADIVGISLHEDLNTCIVNSCTNACL